MMESSIEQRWGLFEIRSRVLRQAFDLQFKSILICLEDAGSFQVKGKVLDVGAGNAPWKESFPWAERYVTVDPNRDGANFRFLSDVSSVKDFELVLLIEVLEHLSDPESMLREIQAGMSPNAKLWMSVPWSARVHGAPKDFARWTPEGLRALLQKAGFQIERLEPRGTDLAVISNKITVALVRRLLKPRSVGEWVAAFFASVIFLMPAVLFGHIALSLRMGRDDDPLGYFLIARKVCDSAVDLNSGA